MSVNDCGFLSSYKATSVESKPKFVPIFHDAVARVIDLPWSFNFQCCPGPVMSCGPRDPNTGEPIEKPGAAGDEASGEAEKVPNLVQ